jgi:flagellar basal body-associated protein FliL
MKPIIVIAGGVVGGIAVAAGLFLFVFSGDGEAAEEPGPRTPVSAEGRLGPHIVLADRVFNLQSTGSIPAYLKLQVLVEFGTDDERWEHVLHECPATSGDCAAQEQALLEEFERSIGTGRQLMEDAVTTIVTSYSVAEVTSPGGKEELRGEIKQTVNALMGERHAVTRVLFLNFITQ